MRFECITYNGFKMCSHHWQILPEDSQYNTILAPIDIFVYFFFFCIVLVPFSWCLNILFCNKVSENQQQIVHFLTSILALNKKQVYNHTHYIDVQNDLELHSSFFYEK